MSDERPAVKSWSLASFKVSRFLLLASHVDNKGRDKFFRDFGFNSDEPEALARALIAHPSSATNFEFQSGKYNSVRLAYDGVMDTPDGRGAHVRTIWNFDDDPTAKFITVIPLPRIK